MMSGFRKGIDTVPFDWLKILLLARKGNRMMGYAELADCVWPDSGKIPPGARGAKMHREIRLMGAAGLVSISSAPFGKRVRPALSVTSLGHAILEDFGEFFDEGEFDEDEFQEAWEAWAEGEDFSEPDGQSFQQG